MANYFGWKGKSPKLEHFLGQENLKIRRLRTGQEQGHEWEFGHGDSRSKKTEATSPVCVSESHWWPSVGWAGEASTSGNVEEQTEAWMGREGF